MNFHRQFLFHILSECYKVIVKSIALNLGKRYTAITYYSNLAVRSHNAHEYWGMSHLQGVSKTMVKFQRFVCFETPCRKSAYDTNYNRLISCKIFRSSLAQEKFEATKILRNFPDLSRNFNYFLKNHEIRHICQIPCGQNSGDLIWFSQKKKRTYWLNFLLDM